MSLQNQQAGPIPLPKSSRLRHREDRGGGAGGGTKQVHSSPGCGLWSKAFLDTLHARQARPHGWPRPCLMVRCESTLSRAQEILYGGHFCGWGALPTLWLCRTSPRREKCTIPASVPLLRYPAVAYCCLISSETQLFLFSLLARVARDVVQDV